ncbi:NAD-dependent epimerase/dehydratase family protein [Oligoflexia bacterium]|nr:NAD-dependent epimerase/dehydratase family protein [Oligoflexia bacterium]
MELSGRKYIVTGGGGFVGKAIGCELVKRGNEVCSISRRCYPELLDLGINSIQADLACSPERYWEVFEGVDTVFHVAAKVDMWGCYDDFFSANVLATRNVVQACRAKSVKRLVYTSSPSVVADGSHLAGIDESYPYPSVHTAYYPQTKAMAEREVLAQDGVDGLRTCALRPHLIWGPGDTNLVPTILERARAGRLVQVGRGENLVDITFIEDCVRAHILAAIALDDNAEASGQAYFISQGSPVNMWAWINDILALHDLPQLSKKLPKWIAMLLARGCEGVSKLLPFGSEPLLTRFLVSEMSTDHYFNIARARKLLGYEPQYSVAEAMRKTFGDPR